VWTDPFGMMIPDLGAEVIEIESIQHLNPTRTILRHIPDVVMQGPKSSSYANRDGSEGF
jgi:crotonobetainyl-CoA:carnitine CoA-transferase CaiB-like acyl-CoA transferase